MAMAFWVSYGLLWVLLVLVAIGLIGLYYHFGQIYLGGPEGRSSEGPVVNDLLTAVDDEDIFGNPVVLPRLREPLLLVFASPSCKLCGQLRAGVIQFAASDHETTAIYILCNGNARSVREWAEPLSGSERVWVVADPRGRQAMRYHVNSTPFCVAVDENGRVRAKGNVNHLEGLNFYSRQASGLEIVEDTSHVSEGAHP